MHIPPLEATHDHGLQLYSSTAFSTACRPLYSAGSLRHACCRPLQLYSLQLYSAIQSTALYTPPQRAASVKSAEDLRASKVGAKRRARVRLQCGGRDDGMAL